MARLTLLFAIHNHQPDGNFGHVFEQAYDDCYRPLVEALVEAPHVKVALHHTGPLFEWIERERPAYFDRLRLLVERGQAELLGGGFYEPMLAVLPERDARGQIAMMSEYLERHFGVRPQGMWLAERVWEPALAKLIGDSGMRFTLVDDGHFRAAGMHGPLSGYYVTEKAGTPLALFPIDQTLRQVIPFRKAEESLAALVGLGRERAEGAAVTYGDDGEKFGVWPHTKEWVWGEGWLRRFFQLLAEHQGEVATGHFGDWMAAHRPTGRVYLPTASYEEMGEWALPADAQEHYLAVRRSLAERGELERARPFVRGGIWQNFLAKYPEANFLHKKMIWVSDKLARAEAKLGASEAGAEALAPARAELYRAQCNCGYWHGLFGGLYLNYLRDAVYRHLIAAELDADRALGEGERPRVVIADVDADFAPEVLLETPTAAAYVKPDWGGGVFELDYRPRRFNLLNVLGRRPEGYHGKLREAAAGAGTRDGGPVSIHDLTAVKSSGLADLLRYDRHPRLAFLEHFYAAGTTLDDVIAGRAHDLGDFADGVYDVVEHGAGAEAARVVLRRAGRVGDAAVTVEKTITLARGAGRDGARLTCAYRLSGATAQAWFAPELSLTLLAGDAPDRYYRAPEAPIAEGERRLVSAGVTPAGPLELVDEWGRFTARLAASGDGSAELWRHPLETASQSEGGFERTYQGSVLLAVWRALPKSATLTLDIIAHE